MCYARGCKIKCRVSNIALTNFPSMWEHFPFLDTFFYRQAGDEKPVSIERYDVVRTRSTFERLLRKTWNFYYYVVVVIVMERGRKKYRKVSFSESIACRAINVIHSHSTAAFYLFCYSTRILRKCSICWKFNWKFGWKQVEHECMLVVMLKSLIFIKSVNLQITMPFVNKRFSSISLFRN